MEEFLATPSLIYATVGDEYGAQIIAQRTPAMAEAWYKLAQENAGVRRVLENMMQGSAWGGVVLTSLSVAIPLLSHHGVLQVGDPFAVLYGGPAPAPRSPSPRSDAPTRAGDGDAPSQGNGHDPMAFRAPDRSTTVEA